jgi:hypothetical protein
MPNSMFAGLVISALAAPAMAADLSVPYYKVPPPAMNWSGCHLGADVDAGWSKVVCRHPRLRHSRGCTQRKGD